MKNLSPICEALEDYLGKISTDAKRLPFIATAIHAVKATYPSNSNELKTLAPFFEKVAEVFPDQYDLLSIFDDVDMDFVLSEIYPLLSSRGKKKLRTAYISLLKEKDEEDRRRLDGTQAMDYLQAVAKHRKIFKTDAETISQAIDESYAEFAYLICLTDSQAQKLFVPPQALDKYIETITLQDLDSEEDSGLFKSKLELLNLLDLTGHAEIVIKRLLDLARHITQRQLQEKKMELITELNGLLSSLSEELSGLEDKSQVSQLSQVITQWYDQENNWDKKEEIVELLQLLGKISGNTELSSINQKISHYCSKIPFDALEKLIKKNKALVKQLAQEFSNDFNTNIANNIRLYDLVGKYLPEDKSVDLVSKLLDVSRRLTPDPQKEYFQLIATLKAAHDSALVEDLFNQVVSGNRPEIAEIYKNKQFFTTEQKKQLKELSNPPQET